MVDTYSLWRNIQFFCYHYLFIYFHDMAKSVNLLIFKFMYTFVLANIAILSLSNFILKEMVNYKSSEAVTNMF